MRQPTLDFTTAPRAQQAVTMAPSARESRRSGLRAAREKGTPQMLAYREALIAIGPATDHDVARKLGWMLSVVNGRRNDWLDMTPGCIGARGRVQVTHPDGTKTSRTLWEFNQ